MKSAAGEQGKDEIASMREHSLAMHDDIRRAIRAVLELSQRAMNGDGSGIRQICFEQDHDYCPTVANDGRILYLRCL